MQNKHAPEFLKICKNKQKQQKKKKKKIGLSGNQPVVFYLNSLSASAKNFFKKLVKRSATENKSPRVYLEIQSIIGRFKVLR